MGLEHKPTHRLSSSWTPRPPQGSFAVYWTASTTGYLAGWVARLVLALFAARLSDSPLLVSGAAFALTMPWLLISLPAGALVDRLDRRNVLFAVHVIRAVAVGGLAAAAAVDAANLALIYVVAFVVGAGETFVETSTMALLPMVIREQELEQANARLVGALMVVEVIGLPLGGALSTIGISLALAVAAGIWVVAAGALLLLRGSYRSVRTTGVASRRGAIRALRAEVAEGVRFLWSQPVLRTIAFIAGMINACWTGWAAVFVLYALEPGPIGLSELGYGVIMTGAGVGGVLGTVLSGPMRRRIGRRWGIGINIAGNAVGFGIGALTANPWIIGAAIIIGGIGGPMWVITATSLQQRVVPDELRGRVTAAYRFIGFGAQVAGPVIAGLAAEWVGIRPVFALAAVLTLVMFVPFARVITEQAMAVAERSQPVEGAAMR